MARTESREAQERAADEQASATVTEKVTNSTTATPAEHAAAAASGFARIGLNPDRDSHRFAPLGRLSPRPFAIS